MPSRLFIRASVPIVANIPQCPWVDTDVREALTDGGHDTAILPWDWPLKPQRIPSFDEKQMQILRKRGIKVLPI